MAPIIDSQTITAIKDALTPLAEKIGQGAAHLYMVFVKQQVVNGASSLVYVLLELAGLVVVGKAARYFARILTEGDGRVTVDWDTKLFSTIVVYLVAGFIGLMIVLPMAGSLTDGLAHVINPEYYAVHDILDTVKGK